jgi:hypothetical protein
LDLPRLGLGPMEARSAVSVPVGEEVEELDYLTITIRTNLVFGLKEFCEYVKIKLIIGGNANYVDTNLCKSLKLGVFTADIKITPI